MSAYSANSVNKNIQTVSPCTPTHNAEADASLVRKRNSLQVLLREVLNLNLGIVRYERDMFGRSGTRLPLTCERIYCWSPGPNHL